MKYKMLRTKSMVVPIVTLALVIAVPFAVSAKNTDTASGQSNAPETSGNANAGSESGSDVAQQKKLEGKSLEKCQNREKAIVNVMARIGDRGEKQIEVIASIQQKVQNFYTEKNLSVGDYDGLVAKVEAKKQEAVTAMNTVRNMNRNFSCGNDDPKGTAEQFKAQASVQSDGVVAYRDAVHELVTEIKTSVTEASAEEES